MSASLLTHLVPGGWVLVLASVLLLLLRRSFDAVPLRVAAVFALVIGLFLGPVLFAGRVLLPLDALRGRAPFQRLEPAEPHANPLQGDLLQLIAPALGEVRAAYARGEWPLWQDKVGAGMPLLANPQAQALQPLAVLGLVLPMPAAAGAIAALRLLGALVFTFLFLRRLGVGELAALVGALAWSGGGFTQLWLGWPLANLAALLPLVLYAVTLLDDRETRRDEALLVVALAALATSGHPEAALEFGLLAAAFATARLLARPRGRRLTFAGRLLRAALLAAGLSAPAWLPAAELLATSVRAAAMQQAAPDVSAAAMSRLPGHDAVAAATFTAAARRLLPAIAPNAFGNGRYADPSGVVYWGWSNSNEDCAGFVGTLACLLALAAFLSGAARRPQERLFQGAAAVAVAVLVLPATWIAMLPGAGQRLAGILGFAVAVAAACELDRWRRGGDRRRVLLLAASALGAGLLWATLAHAHPQHPEALEIVRLGGLKLQLKVLALAVAALWLARRWRSAAGILLLAMVWESTVLLGPANAPSPERLVRAATPATEFLRQRLGEQRMAALGGAFPANEPAYFGLADVRCYDPAGPAAYDRALAPFLVEPRGNVPELDSASAPLFDVLGVRYVLTELEARAPETWRRAFEDSSSVIYERPNALPRFFLPGAARREVTTSSDSPGVESTVDRLPDDRSAWAASGPAPRPRLLRRGPEAWRLDLRLAERRLLASGEYQDGNWRVLADGERVATVRTHGLLVGAWLPSSTTTVDVVYRPDAFLAGMLLAAGALASGLAAICSPARR